jgi:ribose transport system permease protein
MGATEGTLEAITVPASERGRSYRALILRDLGIPLSFVALFVALSLSSPVFLTERNLLNLLDQWSAVGIAACGATLVIIAGGFDLSVGAVYAVAGIVAAKAAQHMGIAPAFVLAVLAGVGLGIANGLIVTVFRVNAFVGTLASSIVIRGVALAITGGVIITTLDPKFSSLGLNKFAGINYSIWVFAAAALFCWFLLKRTTFGRAIYAIGDNDEAARLSGINVPLVRGSTFALSGGLAALAGVVVASRISSGQADSGAGLELQAIAAVAIGGTSILGGEGAIWRTVLGVLFLGMIGNGFNLLNVNPVYTQVFTGGIILLAVSLDAWTRRRS